MNWISCRFLRQGPIFSWCFGVFVCGLVILLSVAFGQQFPWPLTLLVECLVFSLGVFFGILSRASQPRKAEAQPGTVIPCQVCGNRAIIHITSIRRETTPEENHLCEPHAQEFLKFRQLPDGQVPSSSTGQATSEGMVVPSAAGISAAHQAPTDHDVPIELVRISHQ